jgi:hypothetical protein
MEIEMVNGPPVRNRRAVARLLPLGGGGREAVPAGIIGVAGVRMRKRGGADRRQAQPELTQKKGNEVEPTGGRGNGS